MYRLTLTIFLFVVQSTIAQNKAPVWKSVKKDINIGYQISFSYPPYWKFDWVENCLCLGKPTKAPEFGDYNNTQEWGIWMDDIENYQMPNIDFYKEKFHSDIFETIDSINVANKKAIRSTYRQKKGSLFRQSIIFKIGETIFNIENTKIDNDDFQKFLKSIEIKKIKT